MNQITNMTPTMSSLELVEFINASRQPGESELRHDSFMVKVPKVLGDLAPKFSGTSFYVNGAGNKVPRTIYTSPKREACLMAMSYSYDLQAKVYDRMTALEQATVTRATPAIDAPAGASAGSSEATYSLTEMLKKCKLTARQANQILRDAGILTKLTRPSSKGGVREFWSITEVGLAYGKNVTSPQNPRETQPHWFRAKADELISEVLNPGLHTLTQE
jgi:hypothetical protein